jgi:hypothetical protein
MPEEKQLSTISNNAVAVPTRERLQHSPVAQRLYDQTGGDDGIPMGAVAVVAATDRSITTARDSVRGGQVSVKRFAKDFDERTLAALILMHLTIVEEVVNVARPMKPEAMAILAKNVARMLVEDDMTWNLADIQIVADRLANGDAGQVYGGLTGPMVMKAFTEYMGEKCDAFVELREEQASKYKPDFGRGRTSNSEAIQASERVKHMAAREAYQNGTLKKDIKTTDQ